MLVFANAGCEDEGVGAIQFGQVSPDPVARLVNEVIEGEPRTGIAFGGFGFDVANVVETTGKRLEAGFLAQDPFRLRRAKGRWCAS